MGVQIVEHDEDGEADGDNDGDSDADGDTDSVGDDDGELPLEQRRTSVAPKKKEVEGRTDDPVRMYLREMGAVELLSREGEIAIASGSKRAAT
jgi:RNA polymerase primary sigma factor